MQEEKTLGITLRSTPYGDKARIATIFTKDSGKISLILKGLSPQATKLFSLSSPFCLAELIYKRGRSDIFTFVDGSVLEENYLIRNELSWIHTASSITRAILYSQLPNKSSPGLFFLLKTYLTQIPSFSDLSALVASFHLKVLLHEGLFSFSLLKSSETDPKLSSQFFSLEEEQIVHQLALIRSFSSLKEIFISSTLREKILTLFYESI